MRSIRISEEVWQAIAARGSFGETEDDVLRRVFHLADRVENEEGVALDLKQASRRRRATKRMSAWVSDGHLFIEFEDGARERWQLPARHDKPSIRDVRDTAVRWAPEQGASDPGQTNAVRKDLTDAGYYLTR
ncbi:MAG: hypothetical protein WD942_00370 [Dehalococcoidia bacterium]